jgi:hypothetical protein
MKKKLESDVLDLETALEHANAANAETQVYCSSMLWSMSMPPMLKHRYM